MEALDKVLGIFDQCLREVSPDAQKMLNSVRYDIRSVFARLASGGTDCGDDKAKAIFMHAGLTYFNLVKEPKDALIIVEENLKFLERFIRKVEECLSKEEADRFKYCMLTFVREILKYMAFYTVAIYQQEITKTAALEEITRNVARQFQQVLDAQINFLARVSHDMRTPLHSIIGYLSAVKSDKSIPSDKIRIVDNAIIASELLLNLINDVLDAAKVSVGEMELVEEPFWLIDVVGDVYRIFKPLADNKGLDFVLDCSFGSKPYLGDKRRITQIVTNLLSNAVKFTDEGYIRLGVKAFNGSVFIEVEDTGCGIPVEKQREIFKPFQQADVTHSTKGTGLGLFIVRTLVKKMRGDLELESTPGKGTKVKITLPLKVLKGPELTELKGRRIWIVVGEEGGDFFITHLANQLRALGNDVNFFKGTSSFLETLFTSVSKPDWVIVLEPLEQNMKACQVAALVKGYDVSIVCMGITDHCRERCENVPLDYSFSHVPSIGELEKVLKFKGSEGLIKKHLRVLVVDDEPFNREVLAMAVKEAVQNGVEVDYAEDGEQALEKVMAKDYDIIFLDLRMPVMDGIEACKAIRARGVKTPIYILTADVIKSKVEDAEEAGATGFLSKPLRIEDLKRVLRAYGQ